MSSTIPFYKKSKNLSKIDRLIFGMDENKHEPITIGNVEQVLTIKDSQLTYKSIKTRDMREEEFISHRKFEPIKRLRKSKGEKLLLKKAKKSATFSNTKIL